MKVKDYCL